jgi:hypothetical protein
MVGAGVDATLKGFLSIRRWRGGELDRGASRCPHGATRGTNAPWLRGYTRAGRATPGLDSTPSAALAPTAGWVA